MKDGYFESRKEQFEKELLPNLVKRLEREGRAFTDQDWRRIASALKDAAMVGAAEERNRWLQVPDVDRATKDRMCETGVFTVLGYGKDE